jgi:GNAT superfamily N-acetyltransferase
MTLRDLPPGYVVRPRVPADDPALLAVENRAVELLRAHGYGMVADAPIPDVAWLRRTMAGQSVWVAVNAAGAPAGFAVAAPLDGFLHLAELSVDPAAGRRGIGTVLVETVIAAAADAGLRGTSLTTFRNVPFNEPFYRRMGFEELPLDRASTLLRERFDSEVPEGVGPQTRVLMTRLVRS